ncbi:NUDIX hydrolase [Alkalibacter saccharofermentans]|uniref:NUDIX domain-containing protein n=1 Tax=Alkalibacter saccharofermentans DSM 14828 TaxID=1120975 RepID=A0A1M4Z309_9FIRM|nr:CoA pyrophosphatase [Alkalibacter saccharofermentans]SHF12177.1 NUDIX domain-containing protein [Alkalibacter saccharofermentans DSM 14828]
MKTNQIHEIFKNRKSEMFDIKRHYAVFVPLVDVDDKPHLLYQVRSNTMKRQPGEISFPGGKIEKCESIKEAAIRETCEELGVDSKKVKVFGELDYLINTFNDMIYPVLGTIEDFNIEELKINKCEVDRVFTVPLDYFLNNKPEVYDMSYRADISEEFPFHKIKNGESYQQRTMTYPVYFYEYDKFIIWGLTAKITRNLVKELVKSCK